MALLRPSTWFKAAPVAEPAKPAEVGISGTVNYAGTLRTENNSALDGYKAYGREQTWGEFEKLVRTDAAASTALEMVAAPLREATLEVEPADDSDAAKVQADFVRDNLQKWLEPQWPEVCQQLVKGSLTFGFSLHETVNGIRPDKRVPGGQAVYVKKLAQRLPSSLDSGRGPWVEKDGDLTTIRQSGYVDGRSVSVDLPAALCLLLSWGRDGNNYAGYSALRPVWYLGKIRAEILKVIALKISREATGIPVATQGADSTLSDEKIADLQTFLENSVFHENAALVLPKGVSFEWVYSPGASNAQAIECYEKLGTVIKEVLFAQQLSLGTNGTGSRAVGDTHADSQAQFVEGVKTGIEAVLNGSGGRVYTNLVKRIIDPNWGPQEAYPVVRLVLKKNSVPLAEFATAVATLKTSGALTWGVDDENETRARMGLAPLEKEEGAEVAGVPAVAPAAGAESVQDTALNGAQVTALLQVVASVVAGQLPRDTAAQILINAFQIPAARADALLGSVGKSFAPEALPTPQPARFSDAAGFKPSRPLRLSEQHLALAEMDDFLTSAREEFEASAQPLLAKLIKAAGPQVKAALADGDPSELSTVKLDTKALRAHVVAFIAKARAFGSKQVLAEKKRQPAALLKARKAGTVRFAAADDGDEEDDKKEPDDADRSEKLADAQADLIVSRVEARVATQLLAKAVDAVQRKLSPNSIVGDVTADMLDGHQLRSDAGMVLTRSFNLGRQEAADLFGKQILSAEYSAVLDGNQCGACGDADGQSYEFNSAEYVAAVPPNSECEGGEQCRCLMVFTFDDSSVEVDD